jgi:hypothetical protein
MTDLGLNADVEGGQRGAVIAPRATTLSRKQRLYAAASSTRGGEASRIS